MKYKNGYKKDGLVFWAYRNEKEYWVTEEKFISFKNKEKLAKHRQYLQNREEILKKSREKVLLNKKISNKIENPIKKGTKNKDGLYFYRYSSYIDINGNRKEKWLSKEEFDKKIKEDRKLIKKYHLKENVIKKRETNKELNWHKNLFYYSTNSSKFRKNLHENELSPEWILEKYKEQKGLCYWLKVPLKITHSVKDMLKPSLDRLNPKIGYTKENTVISSLYANFGRGSSSKEDTENFLKLLKESILQLDKDSIEI